MRVPLSWLRVHADLPAVPAAAVGEALTRAGLKVERIDRVGDGLRGVLAARVLQVQELTGYRRPVRYVQVAAGGPPRWVICGASNFTVGDLVPLAAPGARLADGRVIERAHLYGRDSDGMICSPAELGLSEDHSGILLLPPDLAPGGEVADGLALRDDVLDVVVTPDRGYCLSVRGLAREAATAFGVPFRDPADLPVPPPGGGYPVRVDDVTGCDRYLARVVSGLRPDARSPWWLQRRLTLAGMRPVSLPVDVTNHVLLEFGQPLHAFDADRLSGPIVVRRAAGGERLCTLDGVDRLLDPDDLLITDRSGPTALAGVIGGGPTEVRPDTRSVLIESAHFDPASISRTARRHRVDSEAARRYTRGVDPALPAAAAEAAVRLLADLAGAGAAAGVTDVDRRPAPTAIRLDPRLPGRLAGRRYPTARVRARLADVGCRLDGEDPLVVHPPSWRPDLREPVDLVEEVARLEGYDRLPATLPAAPPGPGLTREQRLGRRLADAVADAGYLETRNQPFVPADSGDHLRLPAGDPRHPSLGLANPLSDEESMLRATLLTGLLDAVRRNVARGATDLALYEIGPVFRARPGPPPPNPPAARRPAPDVLAAMDAALPEQPVHLAVALSGYWERPGWWGPGRPACWADAVQAARVAAGSVGAPLTVEPADLPPWHPGRCARLVVDGEVVGHAGQLHPRVVEALDLPVGSCAMELAVAPLLAAAAVPTAPQLSTFPVATLDVAVTVPAGVPAAAVAAALAAGGGPLLESLRLFDVYSGPPVPPDHRSLAFAMRLRAVDRTLTAAEALAVRDAAVAEASRRTGAQLRG